jgi:hypothetical protein
MATKEKRGKKTQPRHPEKKWGPFAGGTGVAVWLNEFEAEAGTRYARTITLSRILPLPRLLIPISPGLDGNASVMFCTTFSV